MPDGEIAVDDPRAGDVRELLAAHLEFARGASPPQAVFALDVTGLLDPAVTFYSFRFEGELLGIGAIKDHNEQTCELKSMHTARAARGRGVGRAMLDHLLGVARARGYLTVCLETGSMAEFGPARALYRAAGFRPCGPFGGYPATPYSTFMSRNISGGEGVLPSMIDTGFAELLGKRRQGVLATVRASGWPQLSNVSYAWDAEQQVIRVSSTDDRAKTRNLRRSPRASFHVTASDFGAYVVVEGHAELSEVAADPDDAAVAELIELYRAVRGEHPDWDDYRAAMVRDRRLVIRVPAERAYGWLG